MSEGAAGAHFGGHPDGLHQLLLGRAVAQRGAGVALVALGALGDVGVGNGDELLGLGWQGPLGEDFFAERPDGVVRLGSEVMTLVRQRPAARYLN
jgi:hypothetical protein